MKYGKRDNIWLALHLSIIILATISLLTGLRIASVSHESLLFFSAILPQGYLHYIHILNAYGIYTIGLIYMIYLFILREKNMKKDIGKYHQIIRIFGYFIMLTLMITGGMHLFNFSATAISMKIHFYAALGLSVFLFLHACVYYLQHGGKLFLVLITFQRKISKKDIFVVLFAILVYMGMYNYATILEYHKLFIKKIPLDTFIDIDGKLQEKAWKQANSLEIETYEGKNFNHGKSAIRIAGLHNSQEIFLYVVWEDSTKSMKHLPLVKTKNGWKIKEHGFDHFDETLYYEDKLAILLSFDCSLGAAKTVHFGSKPLKNKPANWHGKGYHYSADGTIKDLWQWKAVRTNDMYLADDSFIGAPDSVRTGERRYVAGYLPDGKESGAYIMNWQWYDKASVIPKRLPKKTVALDIFQHPDTSTLWTIPWYEYALYTPENDHYAPGTIMPSVLYASNRFEGDRADVRAHGIWEKNHWTLELSRSMDTKSEHDVALDDGVCLWISPFDHAQIGHSRHSLPIQLTFEK